jgi:hypothetical protein
MLKRYPIRESRLYKLNSKKRLAALLNVDLGTLRELIREGDNYRVFSIQQSPCKTRTIEAPRDKLKTLHSRLLTLMSRLEPPPYLHSGTKKRSYLTNAAAHIGTGVVVKTDISKFYQTTTKHQVFVGLIREFKCSGDVAMLIADLCTYEGHVPTGSPVSMLLAFYAHKQAFDAQYVRAMKEGNTFTLYVDDITLSGESVNLRALCSITKTLRAAGVKCHKTHLFTSESPKSVTGAIISEGALWLPNRRHLKIVEGISALGAALSRDARESISQKLLGQINEAANVEARSKLRKLGLNRLVGRLVTGDR